MLLGISVQKGPLVAAKRATYWSAICAIGFVLFFMTEVWAGVPSQVTSVFQDDSCDLATDFGIVTPINNSLNNARQKCGLTIHLASISEAPQDLFIQRFGAFGGEIEKFVIKIGMSRNMLRLREIGDQSSGRNFGANIKMPMGNLRNILSNLTSNKYIGNVISADISNSFFVLPDIRCEGKHNVIGDANQVWFNRSLANNIPDIDNDVSVRNYRVCAGRKPEHPGTEHDDFAEIITVFGLSAANSAVYSDYNGLIDFSEDEIRSPKEPPIRISENGCLTEDEVDRRTNANHGGALATETQHGLIIIRGLEEYLRLSSTCWIELSDHDPRRVMHWRWKGVILPPPLIARNCRRRSDAAGVCSAGLHQAQYQHIAFRILTGTADVEAPCLNRLPSCDAAYGFTGWLCAFGYPPPP